MGLPPKHFHAHGHCRYWSPYLRVQAAVVLVLCAFFVAWLVHGHLERKHSRGDAKVLGAVRYRQFVVSGAHTKTTTLTKSLPNLRPANSC